MRRWVLFLLAVVSIVCTSVIAGVIFGVYAFVEDVRFAWRK